MSRFSSQTTFALPYPDELLLPELLEEELPEEELPEEPELPDRLGDLLDGAICVCAQKARLARFVEFHTNTVKPRRSHL